MPATSTSKRKSAPKGPLPPQTLIDQRMAECADLPAYIGRACHIKWDWPASVDRDDLAQIAYLELWKIAKTRPDDSSDNFKGLVTTAMKRRIIEMRRDLLGREQQKVGVNCTFELIVDINQADREHPGIDEFDDVRRAFRQAALNERQQEVVMYLMQGWRINEIARQIGVSATAVTRYTHQIAAKVGPILDRQRA